MVFNIIPYSNEPGLLGELADFKAEEGKEKDDPGSACYERKFKNARKTLDGACQENTGTTLKGCPLVKS